MHNTFKLVALLIAATITLAACGGNDSAETTDGENHNDADIAFATDMIQHHAQALAMVDLTMSRQLDPEVQALAEDIRAAQAPEIETMAGWLQDWDQPIPETVRDHANAHGGGMEMDGEMPGMMSSEEMQQLENASGDQFQDMWLEMMIEHHQGAVEMAQAQQQDGEYQPAINLAKEVEQAQEAEIAKMQDLLTS